MYRSSPAKPAMNPAASSRPCIDSAASCSAAIHPSVRPSSAATSAAVSCRPITSLRYAAASSGVNRRSAARTSTSSPRARSRASGSGGSARLAITRCSRGGRWSSRNAIASWIVAGLDQVVVVEHQHDVAAGRAEVVEQRRQHHLDRAAAAARPAAPARSRRPPAPPSAARRSRSSRRSPGRCRPRRATATRQTLRRPTRRSGQPLREQPRLAETGRCGDEGQLRHGPAVQLLVQPRTRHQAGRGPGRRASSPARGFASASPVASVDLWSAHLAHCRAGVAVTAVDVIACIGPNARQRLAAVVRLLHHEETAMPDAPRPRTQPQRPPAPATHDRAGRAGPRTPAETTPGRMGVHRALRAGVHGHHPGVPRTIAGQPVAEDQLAGGNRAGAEQPGARRRHWRPASDVRATRSSGR